MSLVKKNRFLFSISEIVVYSGIDRTMDFAYLNPISTHLEVEFNNNQNRKYEIFQFPDF